ncbi:MAG: serine hydrolase [Bacilli bacterium]|nr:serine hydrolase [Bacilli bacterium]
MKVSSINCYCKGTDSSQFLKESDYSNTITELDNIKTELESSITKLGSLMSSGKGLSADSLNFGGFSPTFEMAYVIKTNLNTAMAAIGDITTSITNNANAHMSNEWSKFYQEINKHLQELNTDLSGLSSPDDDEEIGKIKAKIKEHEEKLAEAGSNLKTVAGENAVTLALDDAYAELPYQSQTSTINDSETLTKINNSMELPKKTLPVLITSGNLTKELEEYIKSNPGQWSAYIKNLKTGEITDINGDNKMTSASIIKLFVMAAAYDQINKGQVSEANKTTILNNMRNMITVSDNDATNAIVAALGNGDEEAGRAIINNYASSEGYSETSINRSLGQSSRGSVENYTSAKDVSNLLEKIHNGEIDNSDDMLDLLKAQTRTSKIPAGVPDGVTVANKTGELGDVQNDAAIVYSGGDYVIVTLSEGVSESEGIDTIKNISKMTYEEYNKEK